MTTASTLRQARVLKGALLALFRASRKNHRVAIVFNYKHIARADQDDSHYTCHTVSDGLFRRQVQLLSVLGSLVSLDDVRKASNLSTLNFVLALDGVSAATPAVQTYLEARSIPYALGLCTGLTNEGIGHKAVTSFMSWQQVREAFIEKGLVTLVNHGLCSLDMTSLSPEELVAEIDRAEADFELHLGIRPDYFAVPCGQVAQNLALDLSNILFGRGYKGVLWAGRGGNVITASYQAQMMHLCFIQAPATFSRLLKAIIYGLNARQYRIVEQIPAVATRNPYTIMPGDDFTRVLPFENLAKQGNDYRADPAYYRYLHSGNPYRTAPPDYYAVESSGRIESIIYRFPLNFSLYSSPIRGIYAAGWVKLPQANTWASGTLLLKLTKSEPIVGSYKPSNFAAQAMRRWNKVAVQSYALDVTSKGVRNQEQTDCQIRAYDAYNDAITPLAAAVNRTFAFTVERSPQYYGWRFDQYPLATVKYFVLFTHDQATAYIVTLMKDQTLAVSDFYCPSVDTFAMLFQHVKRYSASAGIRQIRIVTSLKSICSYLEDKYRCKPQVFHNYYYFNPAFPEVADRLAALEKEWSQIEFHETQACGDVLLK